MDEIIRIEHLFKAYGNTQVLKDINLTINKGDIVTILGPSGGGKSTLLRCINLMETPTSGAIYVDGKNVMDPKVDIDSMRTKMGMVFQQFNLFNHLNVLDNCTLAQMKVLKRNRQEAEKIALGNLEKVGLKEKAPFKVSQLSGGQKQRVAIARALCMNPEVMLFDEPTSALDPEMVEEVLRAMRNLAHEGMTMVIVTHDREVARHFSAKQVLIENGINKDWPDSPDLTK